MQELASISERNLAPILTLLVASWRGPTVTIRLTTLQKLRVVILKPVVELKEPGSIPQAETKAKRVNDLRPKDV